MASVNIYLLFNGNCEDAFNFYKTVFGREFTQFSRFGDMPEGGGKTLPEEDKDKIMHVSLPIGESTLMGSDTGSEWAPKFVQGNNFSISVNTESKDAADRLFSELSAGGEVTMPMTDTFWNAYFGMFTDKFGINWMINFEQGGQ